MLLTEIFDYCAESFESEKECPYASNELIKSKETCDKCLYQIHFNRDNSNRKYDCSNMMYFYFCKYIFRYSSEIIHSLKQINLGKKGKIKVLSIGCGPATEIFALEELNLNYEYFGFDLNPLWIPIQEEIAKKSNTANFFLSDFFSSKVKDDAFDLVIMNYMLSDFLKYATKQEIDSFTSQFKNFIQTQSCFFIINDINLNMNKQRHLQWVEDILGVYIINRQVFPKRKPGNQYNHNGLYTELDYGSLLINGLLKKAKILSYNPYTYCASAQVIAQAKNDY